MINRLLLFFICPVLVYSQNITGVVLDKKTNTPIESAAVYFDNTTIGTSTNSKGEFSIEYKEEIKSTLVISFLGYKDILLSEYEPGQVFQIVLEETIDDLDEVVINYDDGLTRKQKLRLFKQEFLGASKFGKSCTILNEEDLFLRYDKSENKLYASAKKPLRINNKKLKYLVKFDLMDFEVQFRYVDAKSNVFRVRGTLYTGTTFYQDLEDSESKRTQKLRQNVYYGSVQHFMRALYANKLKEEGYQFYDKRLPVASDKYVHFEDVPDINPKKVTIEKKLSILFNKEKQSEIRQTSEYFFLDKFGNYAPIQGVLFSGAMSKNRLGDALPVNYKPL